MLMPAGRFGASLAASALAARATSMVLAVDCLMMPMPTIGTVLPRNIRRSSTAPRSTRATSASRTRWPSLLVPTTRFRKSSGVW